MFAEAKPGSDGGIAILIFIGNVPAPFRKLVESIHIRFICNVPDFDVIRQGGQFRYLGKIHRHPKHGFAIDSLWHLQFELVTIITEELRRFVALVAN